MMEKRAIKTRAGIATIVGGPNVGKSTLINRVIGSKISIVSPKVQTTRSRIRGIYVSGLTQLVMSDTPGIFRGANRRLDRAMIDVAWHSVKDVDAVVFLVDAGRGLDANAVSIIDELSKLGSQVVVGINKVDSVHPENLLPLTESIRTTISTNDIFMISALKGDGVKDLVAHILELLPEGPWLYPEDQLSDVTDMFMASEITREKLFLQLHQELPYAVAVETTSWSELKDKSLRIEQVVYVTRNTHKPIVLGKNGSRIKSVGESARRDLQNLFSRKIHLFLHVKVRDSWSEDIEHFRTLGLKFDV